MLLMHKISGKIVEVLDIDELTSPYENKLIACLPWEDQIPDPCCYDKQELCFPSGEALPKCWQEALDSEGLGADTILSHFSSLY